VGFVLSFIKIKNYPKHRQACLTTPNGSRFVMTERYETTLPCTSQFPLTLPY
jgi:hypothetical protein